MNYQLLPGDNRDTLKTLADNSIDAIVTDPPYGIDFLGKSWDANTGALETYQECLRVLKPGGHILAFSAARTYHHLAVTLEQAGFEIRDQIMWLYSSGFPKAQDIGKAIERREGKRNNNALGIKRSINESGPKTSCPKCNKTLNGSNQSKCVDTECPLKAEMAPADNEWAGWKTALKPAHEPIVMARKPFKGSCIDNVLTHGVGALNIDATRIGDEVRSVSRRSDGNEQLTFGGENANSGAEYEQADTGRYPSNVIGDIPDYQKFFYCPKVNRKERHIGFEEETIPAPFGNVKGVYVDGKRMAKVADDTQFASAGNNHPTVKPIELMKYLIKLITPPGGIILDPFNGSGSTGMAAVELGHEYIGCELDPKYIDISIKRIEAWNKKDNTFNDLFTTEENK
jgi:DNA modification methylase